MKKIATFLMIAFTGIFISSINASANTYQLDEVQMDEMFANAEVVDFFALNTMAPLSETGFSSEAYFNADKDPIVAFLLVWFLGGFGIHRAYLGTSTGTIIAYILTVGGCGIVWTIDLIMLLVGLINNDISKYVDNPKFFMW